MQAKVEQLESQLNTFEKCIADQSIEDSTDQLDSMTKLLKDIFSQPHDITEADKVRLQMVNQQLIELCQQFQITRDSAKMELSNLMKNKKKVGLYNQLK